jgi:hypothetical protein
MISDNCAASSTEKQLKMLQAVLRGEQIMFCQI